MLSPAMMFSLLSTGRVFGGVHHIAPDVQHHEHLAASTGLDSSSDSVYSVEGHTLHNLTNTHICQEALSKGPATQTCALEAGGLPDGHTQNSACISPKFGGLHATNYDFAHLIDHVRAHREHTRRLRSAYRSTARRHVTLCRSVHRPRTARSSRCMACRCRRCPWHRQHHRHLCPSSYRRPLNPYPSRRSWTSAVLCSGRYSTPSGGCCCSTLPPRAAMPRVRRGW